MGDVIRSIPAAIPGVTGTMVVVVDDGSTDRTSEVAAAAGAVVIRHARRRGVGAAFRSGIDYAMEHGADAVVTLDADGQFDPRDIPTVVGPIVAGEADFVTASRFMDPALVPVMPRTKRWGNEFMARWISNLVRMRFHDVSCGFRAYSRDAFLRLVLLGEFTYTHETFLNLAFSGVRMREVPVRVEGTRKHGQSRVANNLFRYAWRAACIILKTYRDYRPLRFFGRIALALLIPACWLAGFFVSHRIHSGAFTPHKWAGFAAAGLGGVALTVWMIGLVAEMLDRIRLAQDELLFRIRRLETRRQEQGR